MFQPSSALSFPVSNFRSPASFTSLEPKLCRCTSGGGATIKRKFVEKVGMKNLDAQAACNEACRQPDLDCLLFT